MITDSIKCILEKGARALITGNETKDKELAASLRDHLETLELLDDAGSISSANARRALEMLETDLRVNKIRAVRQARVQERITSAIKAEVDAAKLGKKFVQSQEVAHQVFTRPDLRYDSISDSVDNKLSPIMKKLHEGSYANNSIRVAKAIFDPKTPDPIARDIINLRHRLEDMYEAAGGILRTRKDFGVGIVHNAESVMKSTADEWSDFIHSKLDLDRTAQNMGVPVKEVPAVLREMYEVIVSEGAFAVNSMSKYQKVISPRTIHRVLRFQDGSKWLEYNNKFGTGDLSLSIKAYFDKMSRDIAVLQTLGPEADKTLMNIASKLQDTANSKRAFNMLQDASIYWGRGFKSSSPKVAKTMKSLKNLLSSSSLGMTTIDALTVDPINGAFSRFTRGIDLKGAMKGMSESEAREAGYWIDSLMEDIGEYSRAAMDSAKFGKLPHLLFKVNGLQSLTRIQRNIATKAAHTSLSRQAVTGKWNKGAIDLLKRHGLGVEDLGKLDLKDTDYGIKILDINDAFFKGGEKAKIARKLLDAIYEVRAASVITGDPASKAIFSRLSSSGSIGTIVGESAGTFLGYFQGWWRHIGSRVVRDLMTKPGKMAQVGALGMFIPFLMLGGYASTTIRWTLQGKKIENLGNKALLTESLARSGILGYASDYLFTDTRGFGRNTISRLMGMPLNVGGDVFTFLRNSLAGEFKSGEIIRLMRTFTPGRSLPGLGVTLDRLVFDQLRMLTEPGAARKMRASQRRIEKQQDVQFIWDRGR